jgi:hypothetical protein
MGRGTRSPGCHRFVRHAFFVLAMVLLDATVAAAGEDVQAQCGSGSEGSACTSNGECLCGLTCAGGVCCPTSLACGSGADSVCCPIAQSACASGVCCSPSDVCGSGANAVCCLGSAGNACANGVCCNFQFQICNGACCPSDQNCYGGQVCCTPSQICGDTCCPEGATCIDNACCTAPPANTCNGMLCCGGDTVCGITVANGISSYACGPAAELCGEVLCTGFCCAGECVTGGGSCCGGQPCAGWCVDGLCCETPPCGDSCCTGGLCDNGVCCPSPRACDNQCCAAGSYCSAGVCCPTGLVNTGGICCTPGSSSVGGACCPSGQACGSACCASGTSCAVDFNDINSYVCCPNAQLQANWSGNQSLPQALGVCCNSGDYVCPVGGENMCSEAPLGGCPSVPPPPPVIPPGCGSGCPSGSSCSILAPGKGGGVGCCPNGLILPAYGGCDQTGCCTPCSDAFDLCLTYNSPMSCALQFGQCIEGCASKFGIICTSSS